MATELFTADRATTTVSSGGTSAPAGGTQETWTVASSAMFGAASTGVSQFHVADPAAPTEIIAVTNVSGTTWTVTRGAESTTPVTHLAGFTVYQVVTTGFLASVTVNPMTTSGDTIYGGASGVMTRLAGDTSNTRKFLREQSSAGTAQPPAWDVLQSGDVPNNAANTSGTAAGLSATLAVGSGGTGQVTQQAAMDALAGSQGSGQYLRGTGSHVQMSAIQAGDVPTLNQNTTGTAANVTGTVAVANGGTGQVTASAALNALGGAAVAGDIGGSSASPQVTATHLASALPIAQGGTGSTARNFAGLLTPTGVKTTTYSAAAGDYVPCDTTSGSFTVTLPNAPADLTVVGAKQVIQGGTNTVTVACAGSDVFNKASGATTLTLTLVNQGALLQYKASSAIWYVVADDLALAQLDGRYVAQSSLPLAIGSGGTGQGTQQAALDALAGAVTSGSVLRGNGTHVTLAALQAGDIPDLAYVDTVTAGDSSITVTGAADTPSVTSVPGQYAQRIFAV